MNLSKQSQSKPRHVLLVDDDRHLLDSMGGWLAGDQGYVVSMATSITEAMACVDTEDLDLALVDLRLGSEDGMELITRLKKHRPHLTTMLMTGYANIDTGVEAVQAGAFDLLTKPLIDDEILLAFDRALSQQQVIEENEQLKCQLDKRFGRNSIIGNDFRMQKTFDMVDNLSLIHISEPTRPY